MNASGPPLPAWIVFASLAAFGFLLVFVINRLTSHRKAVVTEPKPRGTFGGSWFMTAKAIGSSWLAPTGVMAVFMVLSGTTVSNWATQMAAIPRHGSFLVVHPEAAVVHQKDGAVELLRNYLTRTAETDLTSNRPKWVTDGDQTNGDVRHYVLTSQIWVTEAEANQELKQKAVAIVQADFRERHQGLLESTGDHFVNDDRIVDVAVKERYIELIETNFGKFTEPMHRVWWQVEVSPIVRTELYPAWKYAVVQNRVIVLGSGLAVITMLANTVGLFLTLKKASGSSLRAATIGAVNVSSWIAANILVCWSIMRFAFFQA